MVVWSVDGHTSKRHVFDYGVTRMAIMLESFSQIEKLLVAVEIINFKKILCFEVLEKLKIILIISLKPHDIKTLKATSFNSRRSDRRPASALNRLAPEHHMGRDVTTLDPWWSGA